MNNKKIFIYPGCLSLVKNKSFSFDFSFFFLFYTPKKIKLQKPAINYLIPLLKRAGRFQIMGKFRAFFYVFRERTTCRYYIYM